MNCTPYRANVKKLSENKLYHYSLKEILKLRRCKQEKQWKPKGLWYSCGTAWKQWGDAEDFSISTNFIYELTLDYERILVLSSGIDIDDFTQQFSANRKGFECFDSSNSRFIDWPTIAKDYHGIEISPYIWERRLQYMWYYGWDVASGCIWNPKAIKELKLIHQNAI